MSESIQGRTTQNRFYLSAKIVKKSFDFRSRQSRGKEFNATANAIVLVPEQSTECDCFYSAWLPEKISAKETSVIKDLPSNFSEVVFEAGYPINGYFRGALCPANEVYGRPHIFVMTLGAEERLRSYEGTKIKLTALGDGEEDSLYELKAETKSPYSDLP